jgi:hypothetical protein
MQEPSAPGAPSAPAVPPTPSVPLSALLAREDLALRHLAGPANADLHAAHTSELADPYPYLLGGELLLTAGVHMAGPERDTGSPTPVLAGVGAGLTLDFDGYVGRIVAAGGAALGFGLAPVHDRVPLALAAACEAHGLPLLEVPPRTTFSGVARAVWQLMAQARLAELRRVTEAQRSLAAAASRPDPVPSVLRQLGRGVGGWAALFGPDGTRIAAAGHEPAAGTREALARLTVVVRPRARRSAAPASATDTFDGSHLAAYALGPERGFVLGIAAPHRAAGDHTVASVAAVLLTLLTGEHHSGTGAARSSALVRLLLGATPTDVAPLLRDDDGTGHGHDGDSASASHSHSHSADHRLVVHARRDTPADTARRSDPVAASAAGASLGAALGAALGSSLVDLTGDAVRVLVPAGREPEPQPGWTLGVSAPAGPGEWPAADAQAGRALARARALRVPLVRHTARSGLDGLVPPDAAHAHARTLLAPLDDSPALTETLRVWLSLHGSWDRTAVALSVHRNTVRQRVARCAALLEADLDDTDVRMELWFALRHPEP